jgi:hypothetical protein
MKRGKPLRKFALKKSVLKRLEKRADLLWPIAIKSRDGFKSVVSGKGNPDSEVHAHHCILRKGQCKATRWHINNGVTLTYYEHMILIHRGMADKAWLDQYTQAINKIIPDIIQESIALKRHEITKYTIEEMENIIYNLETFIEQHGGKCEKQK